MRYTIALFVLLLPAMLYAEDVQVDCRVPLAADSKHFQDLQKAALQVNTSLCKTLMSPEERRIADIRDEVLVDFTLQVKTTAVNSFSKYEFTRLDSPFDDFTNTVKADAFASKDLPKFNVEKPPSADLFGPKKAIFYFKTKSAGGEYPLTRDDDCKPDFGGDTCFTVLNDFKHAVNLYRYKYAAITADETRVKLKKLSVEWDQYLNQSRSQTFADIFLTTVIERNHFKTGYLVGPPLRQWSLLHPSIVYEHLGAAPDGEADKFGIAIEWFGVNWWSKEGSFLPIPFGISVASNYAERPVVDDIGHGLMVHLDNKYSIGWSYRNGDNGVYFTLDLIKLIEDKKLQLERYKEKMLSGAAE